MKSFTKRYVLTYQRTDILKIVNSVANFLLQDFNFDVDDQDEQHAEQNEEGEYSTDEGDDDTDDEADDEADDEVTQNTTYFSLIILYPNMFISI